MTDQNDNPQLDDFAKLRMAFVADIKRHVASLRQTGVDFYGYAALPPDYYTAFDPTTIAVAFNCESDIDDSNRGEAYYRYSVDEWQNYVHEGFDAVNSELKALLTAAQSSDGDSINDILLTLFIKLFWTECWICETMVHSRAFRISLFGYLIRATVF